MSHSAYTRSLRALLSALALAAALPAAHAGMPDKSQRSHAQRKVDRELLSAAHGSNARILASEGTFVVVKAEVSGDLLRALREAGARDISSFPDMDTVTAVVPVAALEGIAARDDVLSIRPREPWRVHRYFPTPEEAQAMAAALPPQPKVGSVNW
jgi:hypothetical protein